MRAGADPLGVLQHDVRARRAAGRAAAPCRRRAPARATPCPRPRCPRRACRGRRPGRGASTASSAARSRTLVGEQQLAARRRPQAVLGDLEGALVGDLEPADLLDGVAPELDPQRVLLGRREDVEDAAADGELAALLDQVDPGVGRRRQPLDDVVEVDLVAGAQLDRLEVAEAGRPSAAARRAPARRRPAPDRARRRRRPGGPAGAARPAAGRRCRCAGSAARAAASPSGNSTTVSGSSRSRSARPGPRPRGRWRSRRAPAGRPARRARRARTAGRRAAR